MAIAELKKSETAPPATAMGVKAHKRTLMLAIDSLKADAPALALQAARGVFAAKIDFAALHMRISALEFEVECNEAAVALAMAEDSAAEAAWRASIQELDPDEIVRGITRDSCCAKCTPGGFCIISGSLPCAAGTCSHPLTMRHLWHRSEDGAVHYPYETDPKSYANYLACCKKLKVSPT